MASGSGFGVYDPGNPDSLRPELSRIPEHTSRWSRLRLPELEQYG